MHSGPQEYPLFEWLNYFSVPLYSLPTAGWGLVCNDNSWFLVGSTCYRVERVRSGDRPRNFFEADSACRLLLPVSDLRITLASISSVTLNAVLAEKVLAAGGNVTWIGLKNLLPNDRQTEFGWMDSTLLKIESNSIIHSCVKARHIFI